MKKNHLLGRGLVAFASRQATFPPGAADAHGLCQRIALRTCGGSGKDRGAEIAKAGQVLRRESATK